MLAFRARAGGRAIRIITIGSNTDNVNLRTLHDANFATAPKVGDLVRFIISAGVVIGSPSTATPALTTGSWPSGVTPEVHNSGRIAGRAGNGGKGGDAADPDIAPAAGTAGGPALTATAALKVNNTVGVIAGGGGGGGGGGAASHHTAHLHGAGGGGGGGAGDDVGSGGAGGTSVSVGVPDGTVGSPGTLTGGGPGGAGSTESTNIGGTGGNGGGPGVAGSTGGAGSGSTDASHNHPGAAGGSTGNSITGVSNVSFIDAAGAPTGDNGTVLGPTS